MPARAFVDTNIWLYSLIQSNDDDRHQQAADLLTKLACPVINSQVIREIFGRFPDHHQPVRPRLKPKHSAINPKTGTVVEATTSLTATGNLIKSEFISQ